jgi:hypothetical protein
LDFCKEIPMGDVVRRGLLVVVCVAGCGGEANMGEIHRAALTDSLGRHAEEMLATLRRMDAPGLAAMYGRTETFVHADNGKEIPWSLLEPQMRQYLAAATENDVRWLRPPKVLVLGENAAVIWGVHRVRSDGDSHDGVWTGVLERIGGEWRIVHSHSSDVAETGDR